MVQNKLEPKYEARRDQLSQQHPPAHRFLVRLETEGPAHGLWLSTSTHAHVYKHDSFLMRIELRGRAARPENLVLSPKPHLRIKEDAVERSELLFPKVLVALIMKQQGYTAGWAPRGTTPNIELTPKTPDSLFDALFTTLQQLDLPD